MKEKKGADNCHYQHPHEKLLFYKAIIKPRKDKVNE